MVMACCSGQHALVLINEIVVYYQARLLRYVDE